MSINNAQETPLRYYYVLDGTVYEVPTLHDVLRARLLRLSWLLESAFDSVRPKEEAATAATPVTAAASATAAAAAPSDGEASRKRRRDGNGAS